MKSIHTTDISAISTLAPLGATAQPALLGSAEVVQIMGGGGADGWNIVANQPPVIRPAR